MAKTLHRTAKLERETRETKINAFLALDGIGMREISTGIGFFDHVLTTFSVHSGADLSLKCEGDLYVDGHHTVEDVGIVLGKLVNKALGDKIGVNRFGHSVIPMDESLSACTIDVSGRPYVVLNAEFKSEHVGELDTCLVKEFFTAFANNSGITIHISVTGENDHHKIEAIFKAFAYAFKSAIEPNEHGDVISAKGIIDSNSTIISSKDEEDEDDVVSISEIEMYYKRLDEESKKEEIETELEQTIEQIFGNFSGNSDVTAEPEPAV